MPLIPSDMSVRKSWLNWSKYRCYFSPFVDQSSPNLEDLDGSDRGLQRSFLIDDILFPSGDIRDQIAKSDISSKFLMFWAAKFLGEASANFWFSFINFSHHRSARHLCSTSSSSDILWACEREGSTHAAYQLTYQLYRPHTCYLLSLQPVIANRHIPTDSQTCSSIPPYQETNTGSGGCQPLLSYFEFTVQFLSWLNEFIPVSHATEFNLFPPKQTAYRQFHSIETAVLSVHNDIVRAIDNRELSLLVLLDLSAAFDTVDHHILLNVLENQPTVITHYISWS